MTEIWTRLGISRAWYFSVKAGHRQPSLKVALRFYDETGNKYGLLEGLDADEIEKMRSNTSPEVRKLTHAQPEAAGD